MDEGHYNIPTFNPRQLRNIIAVDEMESLAPIMDAKVQNLTNEETPQVHVLCGQGGRSSFRILKHGLEISEMAVSELPGNPNAVWTVKSSADGNIFPLYIDPFDAFIIVSFVNATLVLSIGDTVEEVTDTGFLSNTPTLAVAQMGEDALVQVLSCRFTIRFTHLVSDTFVQIGGSLNGELLQTAQLKKHAATEGRL